MDSSLLLAWTLQSVQTETTGTCRALDSEVQCSVDRDRQGRAGAAGVAQLEVNMPMQTNLASITPAYMATRSVYFLSCSRSLFMFCFEWKIILL